jgi:predicted RNA-binding protein
MYKNKLFVNVEMYKKRLKIKNLNEKKVFVIGLMKINKIKFIKYKS